jgi:hypothetical protein
MQINHLDVLEAVDDDTRDIWLLFMPVVTDSKPQGKLNRVAKEIKTSWSRN